MRKGEEGARRGREGEGKGGGEGRGEGFLYTICVVCSVTYSLPLEKLYSPLWVLMAPVYTLR